MCDSHRKIGGGGEIRSVDGGPPARLERNKPALEDSKITGTRDRARGRIGKTMAPTNTPTSSGAGGATPPTPETTPAPKRGRPRKKSTTTVTDQAGTNATPTGTAGKTDPEAPQTGDSTSSAPTHAQESPQLTHEFAPGTKCILIESAEGGKHKRLAGKTLTIISPDDPMLIEENVLEHIQARLNTDPSLVICESRGLYFLIQKELLEEGEGGF